MNKVYFIGAGPGDPELITLKGKRLIDKADIILFAGSLVNPEVLSGRKKESVVFDTAGMNLDEIISVMNKGLQEGKKVVRVHTGDPSVYGAIREQMERLDKLGISYEIIPGVSSFTASAAAIKREFTVPDVSQTVILTRREGRTPVPPRESLKELSRHQSSMAIFLSAGLADEVEKELLTAYSPDTPAAVVYKASWPDEQIYSTKLSRLAETIRENNITKTAMILIGDFLGESGSTSKLYDPAFSHGFRNGKS